MPSTGGTTNRVSERTEGKFPSYDGKNSLPRFAVYASTAGNYFFREIRDLIGAGLETLPAQVELCDERAGFAKDVDVHVVIAPHEFYYVGDGSRLRGAPWPKGVVLLNTEQPS